MNLLSMNLLAASDGFFGELGLVVLGIALLLAVGLVVLIVRCWHKVSQGSALVQKRHGRNESQFLWHGYYPRPAQSRTDGYLC